MTPREIEELDRLLFSNYSFREYITTATNGRYQFYAGFDPVIDAFQEIADGTLKRLILNAQPRGGKSMLIAELGTAYFLYRNPAKWVGLTSYAASLSEKFSREARAYFQIVGGTLDDAKGVKEWMTAKRGGAWASGADGAMLGKGFDLGIVDDIFKNEKEAGSTLIRMRRIDWLLSTFWNRAEPDAAIILSMHRWHKYDLIAKVEELEDQSPEHWRVIDREAIKTAERKTYPVTYDVVEDTREDGEAFVPGRYPVEALEKIKTKSEYFWAVQYQQKTASRGSLVYGKFSQSNLVHTLDDSSKRYLFGLDFGAVNETAGIFALDRFGVYTLIDAFKLPDSVTKSRAKEIKDRCPGGLHRGHGGTGSETQQRKEYRSHGLIMLDPKITDVEVQISRVNEWLESGKLKIYTGFNNFHDVVDMLDDCIRNDFGDIVDKSIWHYLDMIRYLVSGEYTKGANQATIGRYT